MTKENIDKIIDAVQDATDLDTGKTSIGLLSVMLEDLELESESQKSAIPKVRLSSLTDDWFNKQVEYERIASDQEDARHAARFNGKSQATRYCWKELQRIIEDEA